MLTIEPGEPIPATRCDCCGGTTTTLTRFVHSNGDAFGIYYARFSDNHPARMVAVAMGLGDFTDGSSAADRTAFALEMRLVEDHFEVMVVDRSRSPWKDATVLGRMLDRTEALQHDRIREVFHVTDHMVVEDAEIKAYFYGQRHDA